MLVARMEKLRKIGQFAVLKADVLRIVINQERNICTRYTRQYQQLNQQKQFQRYISKNQVKGQQATLPSHILTRTANKRVYLVLLPISTVSCATAASQSATLAKETSSKGDKSDDLENMSTDYKNASSIYDFTVKDSFGNDVSLDKYKGNVVLIVNIASQCGLTKNNYKKLTDLKEKYGEKGLKILNFPCNQFGSQMPEGDGEAMVCHLRDAKADIGDVFQKVDVNGANAIPLYQYLKAKQTGTLGSGIKWNFTKFLVNKEGIPINRYAPTTDPMDISKDIEKLL